MNENQQPSNGARLKALLKDTGYKSARLDQSRRLVSFVGRTRDWTFATSLHNGWVHIHTYVCELPDAAGLRANLLEAAVEANDTMSLTKFSRSTGLILELQYREEHVDAEALKNLFGLLLSNAEEYYPRLFRIVSGDVVLESLPSPLQTMT